jgi:hypothetical protein
MKKQIIRTFALFSLLLTLGAFQAVSAQTQRLVVNIPFEFTAGDERLPAGDYAITRVSNNSEKAILIRSLDGRRKAAVMTHSINTAAETDVARLAFTKYGEEYFLAEVWTPGAAAGRAVPRSKSEKSLRRGLRQRIAAGVEQGREAAEGKTVYVNGSAR